MVFVFAVSGISAPIQKKQTGRTAVEAVSDFVVQNAIKIATSAVLISGAYYLIFVRNRVEAAANPGITPVQRALILDSFVKRLPNPVASAKVISAAPKAAAVVSKVVRSAPAVVAVAPVLARAFVPEDNVIKLERIGNEFLNAGDDEGEEKRLRVLIFDHLTIDMTDAEIERAAALPFFWELFAEDPWLFDAMPFATFELALRGLNQFDPVQRAPVAERFHALLGFADSLRARDRKFELIRVWLSDQQPVVAE